MEQHQKWGYEQYYIKYTWSYFFQSIELKDISQTGEYYSEKINKIIEEIGPKKIFEVCTDNAANC